MTTLFLAAILAWIDYRLCTADYVLLRNAEPPAAAGPRRPAAWLPGIANPRRVRTAAVRSPPGSV